MTDQGERRRRDRVSVTETTTLVDRTNYRALLESVMNPRHSQHQKFLHFLQSRTVKRGLEQFYEALDSSDHGYDLTGEHGDVPAGYLRVLDCMIGDYERAGHEVSTREIMVNGHCVLATLVRPHRDEVLCRTTKGLDVYMKPCHQE